MPTKKLTNVLIYAARRKNLAKKTTTAIMRRIWINPPAICNANPPSHISTKIIAIISKIPIYSPPFYQIILMEFNKHTGEL